jgi:dephospho-CoA kinase
MITVGITGGIGAGKSTVVKMFENLGAPSYVMDLQVKGLINSDIDLRRNLVQEFGADTFLSDGSYNTKMVSEIVFNDPERLKKLGKIIEAPLMRDYGLFCQKHKYNAYVVVESAYFFEYGMHGMVDYIIGVDADSETRLNRVLDRDNRSDDEVLKIMSKQMLNSSKMALCDFIVDNNTTIDEWAILRLHRLLNKISVKSAYL